MVTDNFPAQMILYSLSQGLGAESGGGSAVAELRFWPWLTQGGPGALMGSVPPRTGTPGLSWSHEPAPAPQG